MKWISAVCFGIIKHPMFESVTLLVIVLNSVVLAISDPTKASQGNWIDESEMVFLVLYSMEMGLKIMGLGMVLNKGSYLRDSWNVLDFVIVVRAYIPLIFAS